MSSTNISTLRKRKNISPSISDSSSFSCHNSSPSHPAHTTQDPSRAMDCRRTSSMWTPANQDTNQEKAKHGLPWSDVAPRQWSVVCLHTLPVPMSLPFFRRRENSHTHFVSYFTQQATVSLHEPLLPCSMTFSGAHVDTKFFTFPVQTLIRNHLLGPPVEFLVLRGEPATHSRRLA